MAVTWSLFDVLGPVMVGPSSSHTAGACYIGYMAQAICGKPFTHVTIELHGSFAEVYAGHATDRALLSGALGFLPHDDRLKHAFDEAAKRGITYEFIPTDLGEKWHPNTARLTFDHDDSHSVIGSSLGGGKAAIYQIGKMPVELTPEYSILLVFLDTEGERAASVISEVSSSHRLADLRTYHYKDKTLLTLHARERFTEEEVASYAALPGALWARHIPHPSHITTV